MIDFTQNHFALFGLEPKFQVDMSHLDTSFRTLQAQVHPDKFSSGTDAERRLSMQCSTHVNEAYQTLKSPISRARYLLSLHGVDTQEETNTAMPPAFLMEQMEWREAIGEARETGDPTQLDHLAHKLRQATQQLVDTLGQQLDQPQQLMEAATSVRKLRFFDKLREEINDALETLEN